MNLYYTLSISCIALIVAIVFIARKKSSRNKYQSYSERKTIEIYGYLPKAGNTKQYCIGIILFLLIAAMSGCSPTASLPNGCKYKINAPKFTK